MTAPEQASASVFGILVLGMWMAVAVGFLFQKSGVFRAIAKWFREATAFARVLALVVLLAVTVYGGSKGGNNQLRTPHIPVPSLVVDAPPRLDVVSVSTNHVAFRSESASAVEETAWRKHGALDDALWLDFDEPVFAIGTNPVSRLCVSSAGAVSFESVRRPRVGTVLPDLDRSVLLPFRTVLGFVPEANGNAAGADSRFWHAAIPGGGRVLTWENELVDRVPGRRVSYQVELDPSGDCVFRYDFADTLDPPATNFAIGAQASTNGVNALAVLGTNILSATVWNVGGASVAGGVSVADLLCTNGILKTPGRFAIYWKNTTGLDPNADTDGDGLSDWDEVFRHGTDPNQADTDGDGLSDSAETLVAGDPLDADENGDGVPDGVDSATWAANALWGDMAGETNLVISLTQDIPAGETATLTLGSLSLPLRQARHYPLCIEPGQLVTFRLFSTCSGTVPLAIQTGAAPMLRAGGPLRSPPNPVPPFTPAPLWTEDPDGVFDGDARNGDGSLAHPILYLTDESGRIDPFDECIHSSETTAAKTWTVSVLPSETGLGIDDVLLWGFQKSGPDTISLSVGFTPGETASGTASLTLPKLRIGDLSESRSIHRCRGYWNGPRCSACGRFHRPGHVCSHAPDCAAVLDSSADCSCESVYVHVAWRDADGNGVEDRNDPGLVPGSDWVAFTALDGDEDGCCCWLAYENDLPFSARLLSHSSNLRVFDATGALMTSGSTSTVFAIQAADVSSAVKGSQVAYELLGPTNNVLRTLHVPVTAWDIWDTGLSFNCVTNDHATDAINLRKDYGNPIDYTHGEWEKPKNHFAGPTHDEPACWIAGTRPTIKARFEIAPPDIRSATLSAGFSGSILSSIPDAVTSFSNGVTRSIVTETHSTTNASGAPISVVVTNVIDYAPFQLDTTIPTVVTVSTNETWHWYATAVNGHAFDSPIFVATNGPSKAFSTLDEPNLPWTDSEIAPTNVWASALEFVTKTNACEGATSKTNALSRLSRFLFEDCDYQYDTWEGKSHFIDTNSPVFHLSWYIGASDSGARVNCFDQAHALSFLGRTAGVDSNIMVMNPFGYLNIVRLVGCGESNNPFYNSSKATVTSKICGTNNIDRTSFFQHCFVLRAGMVFDACSGPALGDHTLADYVSETVDTSTPEEQSQTLTIMTRLGPRTVTIVFGDPSNCNPISFTLTPQ